MVPGMSGMAATDTTKFLRIHANPPAIYVEMMYVDGKKSDMREINIKDCAYS
jgi:hypothetical protein